MERAFQRNIRDDAAEIMTIAVGADGQTIRLWARPRVEGLRGRPVCADLAGLESASVAGLLGAVIGGEAPLDSLPPFLREAASARLDAVSGRLDDQKLSYLAFTFALPGRHAIVPSLLEIEDVRLDLAWMTMGGSESVESDLRAGATLRLGDAPVAVSIRRLPALPDKANLPDLDQIDEEAKQALGEDAFAALRRRYAEAKEALQQRSGPDFVVEGALAEEVEIAPLLQRFGLPFPAGPKLSALGFLYDTRTARYRFDITATDVLSLSDGVRDDAFRLSGARLALEGVGGEGGQVHGVLSGTIQLHNTEIAVSAATGSADDGWLLQGRIEIRPDKPHDNLADDLAEICDNHFGRPLSKGLTRRLRLVSLDVAVDTAAARVSISAAGSIALDPEKHVEASLEVTLEKGADGWHETVGGYLAVGSGTGAMLFDIFAEHDPVGGSLAAVFRDETGGERTLGDAIGMLSRSLAEMVPSPERDGGAAITARIPRALACATWSEGGSPSTDSSQMLFALDIDGGLDLTAIHFDGLPLIGDLGSVIGVEPLRLSAQVFIRKGEGKLDPDSRAGRIASDAGFAFPADGLDGPFVLSATLQFGDRALQVAAPAGFGKDSLPPPVQQGPEAKADPVSWVQISKRYGPLHLERVGVSFGEGIVTAHMEASLAFGGATLSLQDLTASAPINALGRPSFGVGGLGLAMSEGSLEIGGAFLRTTLGGAPCFAGGALVRGPTFSLNLSGGFVEHKGHPSFIVYGVLDYPLGGPPFFYVTKLAAGFGVNRTVAPPTIDGVENFSLVRAARAPDAQAPATPLDVVKRFAKDLPPMTGETFLALGVGFTTFKAVDSFAVVVGRFGHEFALDLVGVSTIRNPPGAAEPVVSARIGWLARFRPEEGALLLRAKILPGAYIFAKDCPLTGEFAFACWFKDGAEGRDRIVAGDFVATLGGYHPSFDRPAHYPEVSDRLAIAWKPNANLTVKGQAYVALCPHAVMAGGRLDAVWEEGAIRAWFRAAFDVVICWEPYHYDVTVTVNMGVTVTLRTICTVTVTLDASARLHLWGPDFAGEAEVHLKVLGLSYDFNIAFKPGGGRPEALGWDGFVKAFVPRPEGRPASDGAALAGEITCERGLWSETEGGRWIVDPASLALAVVAAAPLGDSRIGVAPMGLTPEEGYGGAVEIILELDGKRVAHDACFDKAPILRSVPAAVWGAAPVTLGPDGRRFVSAPGVNAARLIDDVAMGYRLTPKTKDDRPRECDADGPVRRIVIRARGFNRKATAISGGSRDRRG